MNDINVSVRNGVGTIELNRPEKKNAFTMAMIDRWGAILGEFRAAPEVRAIVLAAAGDGFCAGIDFSELDDREPLSALEWKQWLTERIHRIALTLEDIDKPVIAAVNGAAVGAGMDMALMCDMRFAGRSARFSEGYVRIGLVPGDGGCYYLPRLVGPAKALELLLTGDFIDADEAARLGIVNRVYGDDELREQTQRFAEKLAANSPIASRMIKRTVYQSMRSDLRTSLDLISSHMAVVTQTHDSHEALAAFRERRTPEFKGR